MRSKSTTKKRTARAAPTTNKSRSTADEDFEREFQETDYGDAIKAAGGGTPMHGKRSVRTSVVLRESMRDELVEKANKRGIGYQTLLKLIVAENLKRY